MINCTALWLRAIDMLSIVKLRAQLVDALIVIVKVRIYSFNYELWELYIISMVKLHALDALSIMLQPFRTVKWVV